MKEPRKIRRRIMITLSPHWQSKLLTILSSTLGINETFVQDHEIIMTQHAFAAFIARVAMMENPPTLKQLNVQAFDLNRFPVRSYANYVLPERENGEESSADDHRQD